MDSKIKMTQAKALTTIKTARNTQKQKNRITNHKTESKSPANQNFFCT